MTAELVGLRKMLRSQKVFPDGMPEFDPDAAPEDPVTLFLRRLEAAIQEAVPAPHAMTLATADDRGRPSSRVLICKDVDTDGRWYFASGAASGKGRDLAVNPGAALSFFWPQQGRQIRVRGTAVPAGEPASAADFLARPPASRAESTLRPHTSPILVAITTKTGERSSQCALSCHRSRNWVRTAMLAATRRSRLRSFRVRLR